MKVENNKMQEQKRRKRNRTTNYDKDIHIRIHSDYYNKITQEAERRGITKALMARLVIEEYFEALEN